MKLVESDYYWHWYTNEYRYLLKVTANRAWHKIFFIWIWKRPYWNNLISKMQPHILTYSYMEGRDCKVKSDGMANSLNKSV